MILVRMTILSATEVGHRVEVRVLGGNDSYEVGHLSFLMTSCDF